MSIKVLVVDDSAVTRTLLTKIINSAPDLSVVGSASNPIVAREMIKALNPDVLTLDVDMPKMDGLDFLGRLMRLRPMPVIMISAFTDQSSEVTLQALALGAIDCMAKPSAENAYALQNYAEEICEKIRIASSTRLKMVPSPTAISTPSHLSINKPGYKWSSRLLNETVIAIGASTGGTEAIKTILHELPENMPPIVMVQHIHETFTPSFARSLDSLSPLKIIEAQGGEHLQPGIGYLAPGHSHMSIRKSTSGFMIELSTGEPVNRHRPSVDVLFDSVAEHVRGNAIGIILTGMGRDGAHGLLKMREADAWNIGQDQASCVVYGMPREAAQIGALDEVASLHEIPACLLARLKHLDR